MRCEPRWNGWDKVIWLWLIVQRKLSWLGFNLG
jgi:hypothetical protein